MVHFIYNNDVILTLKKFKTDDYMTFCTLCFEYDGFTVERDVELHIECLSRFRSELFYFNDNQRDEVELNDYFNDINIKIEKGPMVTISINDLNEWLPQNITFSAKFPVQLNHLETIYEELFTEMELLGLNGCPIKDLTTKRPDISNHGFKKWIFNIFKPLKGLLSLF